MRRVLFLFTLALYAWSAMEMHEWVRVPQVVLHILEHHSDFGHHDDDSEGHQHADLPPGEHDHTPFDDGCSDVFCACSGIALASTHSSLHLVLSRATIALSPAEETLHFVSFSGSKWNPPRA